jgi:hypothetical protein
VAAPAGRCGCNISLHAFSMSVSTHGVANTITPLLPSASAVRSAVTVRVISWLVPAVRLMMSAF